MFCADENLVEKIEKEREDGKTGKGKFCNRIFEVVQHREVQP